MTDLVYNLGIPVGIFVVLFFLTFRMRWFAQEAIPGKGSFLTGLVLVFLAGAWQMLQLVDGYDGWFVDEAYAIFDVGQMVLYAAGGILIVIAMALCSDFWQDWANELSARYQRLSLLENLQRVAREPYELLQLLEISL